MSSVIAFFPWASVQSPVSFGPLRLFPYRKGILPGNLPHVMQVQVDEVLSAYADRPNFHVHAGALLEFADWHLGMDISDEQLTKLFRARHLLAFSALSQRQLFHHSNYSNFDTYSLVIQRFNLKKPSTFSIITRRRDGRSRLLWAADNFAFHRPLHVDGRAKIDFDETLLLALLNLPSAYEYIYEAIIEFNLANTDSSDVPEHVEVVMCKSAFEWLLQVDSKVNSFVVALNALLSGTKFELPQGPLVAAWTRRWQQSPNLLSAWAKDFCAVRGKSAHGAPKTDFVWSSHQHLAFIAMLFPLLVKKSLSDAGLLVMTNVDIEKLRRIEMYLAHDPFDFDWDSNATHPWSDASSAAMMSVLAKRLYPNLD